LSQEDDAPGNVLSKNAHEVNVDDAKQEGREHAENDGSVSSV